MPYLVPVPPEPPAIVNKPFIEEVKPLASSPQEDARLAIAPVSPGISATSPPERFAPESSPHSDERPTDESLSGAEAGVVSKPSQTPLDHLAQVSPLPHSVPTNPTPEGIAPTPPAQPLRQFDFQAPGTQQRFPADVFSPDPAPPRETILTPDISTPSTPTQTNSTPSTPTPANPSPGTVSGLVELTADRQEYEVEPQVVTAEGNVLLRFQGGTIDADRLQLNIPNRIVVGEGNVAFNRGEQTLRGSRLEYYLVQQSGVLLNGSGEVYQPTFDADLLPLPTDRAADTRIGRPLSDRLLAEQPLTNFTNPGGYVFVVGGGVNARNFNVPQSGGTINRIRFVADRVDFDPEGAVATNARLTNDPFSPPELEIRSERVRFRRIAPLVDEIIATRPRIVFDQSWQLPFFPNRIVLDRRQREPALFNIGFDGEDRGGVFIESTFVPVSTQKVTWTITPQIFIQRALFNSSLASLDAYGVRSRLNVSLNPRSNFEGNFSLTSLDLTRVENNLRASARFRQVIGTRYPHNLNLEYSYRDRLFNGSLGFQTVQQSLGAVLTSPVIPLGSTGINLSYQAGLQLINADTDRAALLGPAPKNNRVTLTRYQASASVSRSFRLWEGKPLPATPTEGMRYTPVPLVPFVGLNTSLTGVATGYSSGDRQDSLTATIGLVGQFGHFSRPYLDYTGFNLSYSQSFSSGQSPFLFDRQVDNRVVSGGITQQIYGPFRAGFQTSINLDTSGSISTDYFVEYSRRTYNIVLRYNPVLQLGSISFRINDINWSGNPEPFPGSGVRPVVQGVTRD